MSLGHLFRYARTLANRAKLKARAVRSHLLQHFTLIGEKT